MPRPIALIASIAIVMIGAVPSEAADCHRCTRTYVQPGPAVVQVFEAPIVDSEIYIVNQGPVFSGPGAFRYQPAEVDRLAPREYPYIGASYYPPYDGGPYADPIRHQVLHPYVVVRPRRVHWQPSVVAPRVITADEVLPRRRHAPRRKRR